MPVDRREEFYHEKIRQYGPQYAGFHLLSAETALDLLFTYDVFHQSVARSLAEAGLSKSTFNILMLLGQAEPDGMLLHDLGELLLVSRANVTGLIDHLEEAGYVRRTVNPRDRRGRCARLTPAGTELLDRFAPVHFTNITQLLQDLSSEDKRSLISLLRKTRASIMHHGGDAPRKPSAVAVSKDNY